MTELPISPAFTDCKNAIVLQSDNVYTPYVAVSIQSVIDYADSRHNYDIIVKTLDMSEENASLLEGMADGYNNISVRVVNVKTLYEKYVTDEHITGDKRFAGISVIKTFLPELLENYEKAIHVDSDMIVFTDVYKLFDTDIGDNYAAAVQDIYVEYMYYTSDYVKRAIDEILGLDSTRDYHSAAFMLFDLNNIRKDFTVKQMIDYIVQKKCELFEQDAFNHFFKGRFYELGYEWNFPIDSRRIIENGNKEHPSPLYQRYIAASPNKYVSHYCTVVKPWSKGLCPEAVKWWNVAVRSPLYKTILDRRTGIDKDNRFENRMLFVCETVFQLINILNIKWYMYPDVKADIAFTSSTDFTGYIETVKNTGMFENVFVSQYRVQKDMQKFRDTQPNKKLLHNPSSYEYALPLTEKYTDYFMSVSASPFQIITYYQIVKLGVAPRIHIFEDGSDTYITNIMSTIENDAFDHNIYKKSKQFINNICELMFYEPELYSGGDGFALTVLPKIKTGETDFVKVLCDVFGKYEMPPQKYIYLNECFATDKIPTNDIQLLDKIAEAVGKENITVKLHPRAEKGEQLYKLHGYSIFAERTVPLEMFVITANMEDKVLISVSSNTLINPYIVFNKPANAIFLKNVMKLSQRAHVRNPRYRIFFGKTMKLLNNTEKKVFCPDSLEQLYSIIEYLEGEL